MKQRAYVALGDSMSIDLYTGVVGGGAAAQFYNTLGFGWSFQERTKNMCIISQVPVDLSGDILTLTIGGNDLITKHPYYLCEGMHHFKQEHLRLLRAVRSVNPDACFIVGNLYAPQRPLAPRLQAVLHQANGLIAENVHTVQAYLADVYQAFAGHEDTFLCSNIEPTLEGAKTIAALFKQAADQCEGITQ